MINVQEITQLHADMVDQWHSREVDNPYEGLLAVICKQCSFNFLLWHEEDIARSREVSDQRIAEVKRAIDGYNQQRNDWIEKVDDCLTTMLAEKGIEAAADAPLNTETPGSVIDRLSILALRIYHLNEQTQREDIAADLLTSVEQKLAIAHLQHADLSNSLQQLINHIFAGTKRHKTYRQMKMYNDPRLNPYLYKSQRKAG
jgi:hypothetical protein